MEQFDKSRLHCYLKSLKCKQNKSYLPVTFCKVKYFPIILSLDSTNFDRNSINQHQNLSSLSLSVRYETFFIETL